MAKRPVSTEYTVIDARPVPPQTPPELRVEPKPQVIDDPAPPRNIPRRIARFVIAVVVMLVLAAILVARLTNFTTQATIQAAVVPVAPSVAGKVIELGVVDNAVVRAGDLLIRIDPEPYEIAVRQAEARLAEITQAPGDGNPTAVDARAALEMARLNLQHATVTAPSDGVVTGLRLAAGQFVVAGETALTLIDMRKSWISANIKESSLEHMVPGDHAEIVLGGLPGQVFSATVESIGSGVSQGGVDPATGLARFDSWLGDPQLVPVKLAPPDAMPTNIRYGSHVSVIVYVDDHPVLNALGWLWIRVVAVLGHLS